MKPLIEAGWIKLAREHALMKPTKNRGIAVSRNSTLPAISSISWIKQIKIKMFGKISELIFILPFPLLYELGPQMPAGGIRTSIVKVSSQVFFHNSYLSVLL